MSNSALPDLNVGTLFSQEGKVVVITGGGTGLGLMMATAFVQNGAKVVYIASRKLKNLEGAAKMLNGIREGSAVPLEADLTTAKGCQALGDEIKQRESTVDVLINNSGVSWGSEMESTDEKKGWDRVFDVNVKSLFYLTVALLPLLEKNTSPSSPASVINISSIYGSLPFANMPTLPVASMGAWSYLASKAAASHLTRTLSVKLKPRNVNVNALAPGFFPSNMTSTARDDSLARSHPAGLAGEAKDIAAPALLLAGKGGAHLSGITITTDGGASLVPPHVFPKDIAKLHMPPERFERLLAKL